ncbi:Tyrosine-protein phosphatase 1 [Nakaseomyces bracarensis]|uniref:Tyrosine-protein phosphatase 1 n=1 Tax=Nakaseomyces bracarensis TaxID=273131 RepID=A0ABR4NN67_9SACH
MDGNIPWYIRQTDKELLQKFKFIQNQEDERLREATIVNDEGSRWSLGVSILEMNDYRNRYVNIMPYERNRVKLAVRDYKRQNDYINASYVKVDVPEQSIHPGYYIATQGPTERTWQQFWQMCYNECPHGDIVVVMVTPLVEHHREKCFKYWPSKNDQPFVSPKLQSPSELPMDVSEFREELTVCYEDSERVDELYTYTRLTVKGSSTKKTVHHFYFDQWRDMSKPEEIVPIVKLSEHSHGLNSKGNPIIVHCSAGVGRSGTFIALDHLVHETKDFKNLSEFPALQELRTPDKHYKRDLIEQIVLQLRSQRMKMVQMKDQYTFIYHAARYLYENME